MATTTFTCIHGYMGLDTCPACAKNKDREKAIFKEGTKVMWDFSSSDRREVTIVCEGEPYSCVEDKFGKKHIVLTQRLEAEEPKTIKIGNYDVPEPIKDLPNLGKAGVSESVWIPAFNEAFCSALGVGNSYTRWYLENNLCHWTKEAAILHAKALLSFTTTEQQDD